MNRYGWLRMSHLQWLRRRWWLLLLCPLVAVVNTAALKPTNTTTYRATAVVVVNACQPSNCPGSANEANALATTYAGLIPQDQSVLAYVSQHDHPGSAVAAQTDVRSHVSVTQVSGTSLLQLTYSDPNAQVAEAGANALAQSITRTPSTSQAVPTGAVTLVHTASDATASNSVPGHLLPISAILGLILGFVLVFAFERIDARIDTPDQLAMVLGTRVTALDGEPAIGALRAWENVGTRRPAVIALTPLGSENKVDATTDDIARQLVAEAASEGMAVRVLRFEELATLTRLPGPSLILVGLDATEAIDPARVDALVAAVGYGEPVRAVRKQAAQFRAYGKAPIWGLITTPDQLEPRGRPESRLRPADDGGATDSNGVVSRPRYEFTKGSKALP